MANKRSKYMFERDKTVAYLAGYLAVQVPKLSKRNSDGQKFVIQLES